MLYIVGAPRSGTHLIRFCLEKGNEVYVPAELGLLYKIYGGNKILKHKYKYDSKLISNLILSNEFDESIKELIRDKEIIEKNIQGSRSAKEIIISIEEAIKEISKKSIICEKTPNNLFFIDKYVNEDKVIHVIREWKSTVSSMILSNHMSLNTSSAVSLLIISRYFRNRICDNHVYDVNYENLTQNPEFELKKICRFLNVTFNHHMLSPGAIDSSYSNEVIERDKKIGIRPNNPEKWKTVLTPFEGEFVDTIYTKSYFRLLKYPSLTVATLYHTLKNALWIWRARQGLIGIFSFKKYRSDND